MDKCRWETWVEEGKQDNNENKENGGGLEGQPAWCQMATKKREPDQCWTCTEVSWHGWYCSNKKCKKYKDRVKKPEPFNVLVPKKDQAPTTAPVTPPGAS